MASSTTSATKATATAKAAPKIKEDRPFDFVVLGIALGAIIGFILIILVVLWIIKCIRRRRNPNLDDKKDGSEGDAERATGSAMAIVMTAVTSPSSTNPPRLLGTDKRHNRNRTLGSSAGGSTSTIMGGAGRVGKGSISNPTMMPHTTTDAFSQKNFKHFPISRPLPVHQHTPQGSFGSQTSRLAAPMGGPVVNFAHPHRPVIGTDGRQEREVRFPPSNVVRPLRPSVVGRQQAMMPRQATTTTQGVLAPPSSSSGATSSAAGQGQASGPQRNGSTRRSSGWNRYWSGGSALNMMGFNGNRNSNKAAEDRTSAYTSQTNTQTHSSDRESVYSTDSQGRQRVLSDHQAFIPPPLNFAQSGTRMARVSMGSPKILHPENTRGFPLQTGRVGHISGRSSVSSLSSYNESPIDAFSSGVPTSEPEAQQWNPLAAHDWNVGGGNRGTSSVYTDADSATMPKRADLVDSYYAKSNGGSQYELNLPKQGQVTERDGGGYGPNEGRQRMSGQNQLRPGQQPQQQPQFLKPPGQQQRPAQRLVPELRDEYGRPHDYPTHQEQQRMLQQQRQAQQQPQQPANYGRYDGAQYPYPSSRTQYAQRAPGPRSDDMSWLNLGR